MVPGVQTSDLAAAAAANIWTVSSAVAPQTGITPWDDVQALLFDLPSEPVKCVTFAKNAREPVIVEPCWCMSPTLMPCIELVELIPRMLFI